MKTKIIFQVNRIYSKLWIAVFQADKYEYRDRSKVHGFLMNFL